MDLVCMIGQGYDPFPCLNNIWSIYSKKGPKTILLSVGNSDSCMADLELAELLGCPLHVVPLSSQQNYEWNEVLSIVKARSRPPTAIYDFSKGADTKWVLARNLVIHESMPSWSEGPNTEPFFPWVEAMCGGSDARIDILKIDMKNGLERPFLYALLDAGFRPGCIMVAYTEAPDTSNSCTLVAGHLQMCGYSLVNITGKKCLYYYTDENLYVTCSWEDTSCRNPIVKEIVTFTKKSLALPEGNSNNVTRSDPLSKTEATRENNSQEATDQSHSLQ